LRSLCAPVPAWFRLADTERCLDGTAAEVFGVGE
jgi:hypothetical protein